MEMKILEEGCIILCYVRSLDKGTGNGHFKGALYKYLYHQIFCRLSQILIKYLRSVLAQELKSVTENATGCGYDPYPRKLNIY